MQIESRHAKKIKRLSVVLKWAVLFVIIELLVSKAAFWLFDGFSLGDFQFHPVEVPGVEGVEQKKVFELLPIQRFFGFCIAMIPTGFLIAAMWWLRELMARYQRLEVFSFESVRCISNIGWCLLLKEITAPVVIALNTLNLTIFNPPGERMVATGFDVQEVPMIIMALAILIISWIMKEACKLQEELEGTV